MTNRFRPLLATLMASALSFPVAAYAQDAGIPTPQADITAPADLPVKPIAKPVVHGKKAHAAPVVKPILDAAPEKLDPAAEMTYTTQVDVDAEMTAGNATDQTQSLFDAMRWAYDHSSTIRAAREQLLAVQENLPQAQSGWKPTATAGAGVTKTWLDTTPKTVGGNGGTEKDLTLSVNQPLYRGGRTMSGVSNAKNIIMAQRALLNGTESQVLLNVVTAYMNVLRDQSLLDLATNNRDVINKQLDATNARFNVGDVTRTDVSQARARLADAESGIISARGNLQSSRAVYTQVVGMPPGRLSMPKMTMPIPPSLDESVGMAMRYNPYVIAAQFTEDAAKDNVTLVDGELLPTVGLNGGVTRAYDPSPGTFQDQTVKSIGINATIPLYEAGSVRSRVRQAKSISSQRQVEVLQSQESAREQTVSSWETLQATTAEIDSRKEQVKANAIARDGVHKEAELGTRTILDALNADQELLNSRSALVTARRDEVVARYTLASAIGLMNPNAVGFPELTRDYNQHIREISAKIFSTSTDYSPDKVDSKPTPQKPVNR
ncbi:MAG: Type secretion outer membrane protein TolC precursor [Micavibrio sp.]|nr:Type secretion outer membrane protein TolC precursor [Micavibrio sp.]